MNILAAKLTTLKTSRTACDFFIKTARAFCCVCGKCPTLKRDDGLVQDFEVVTRKGAKTVLRHINGHDNAKIFTKD